MILQLKDLKRLSAIHIKTCKMTLGSQNLMKKFMIGWHYLTWMHTSPYESLYGKRIECSIIRLVHNVHLADGKGRLYTGILECLILGSRL